MKGIEMLFDGDSGPNSQQRCAGMRQWRGWGGLKRNKALIYVVQAEESLHNVQEFTSLMGQSELCGCQELE